MEYLQKKVERIRCNLRCFMYEDADDMYTDLKKVLKKFHKLPNQEGGCEKEMAEALKEYFHELFESIKSKSVII